MKSTGIVRKGAELGRIVIPIELRRTLEINEKDPVEIFVDGERAFINFASRNRFLGPKSVTSPSSPLVQQENYSFLTPFS